MDTVQLQVCCTQIPISNTHLLRVGLAAQILKTPVLINRECLSEGGEVTR